MAILALETSSAQGGVALLEGGTLLAHRHWKRSQSHSELLTAAIKAVLDEASFDISKLESLAVGVGPGSFTGIRVAVSAAKSMGFARHIKIRAFDSSEILVAGRSRTDLPVITAVNALKNQIFYSRFEASDELLPKRVDELRAVDAATIGKLEQPHLLIGDGIDELVSLNPDFKNHPRENPDLDLPRADVLARIAWQYRSKRPALDWKDIQPLYLRTSGAEEKLRGSNVETGESSS